MPQGGPMEQEAVSSEKAMSTMVHKHDSCAQGCVCSEQDVHDIIAFIESNIHCRFCKKKTLTVVQYQTGLLFCHSCNKKFYM